MAQGMYSQFSYWHCAQRSLDPVDLIFVFWSPEKTVKQKIASAKRTLAKKREGYTEERSMCEHVCKILDEKISVLEGECARLESELSFQGNEHHGKMEQVANDVS